MSAAIKMSLIQDSNSFFNSKYLLYLSEYLFLHCSEILGRCALNGGT